MISAKEYLEQVRKQADRVEDLKQDVQYLDDGMTSIGSTSFCKTGGHSGSPQAGFVLLVERKDAKQRKNHLAELIAHADAAIDTVPDPKMRRVLKLYYLENLSTKEVAEKMNYTVQHVNRLMNKGLEMVQLPEEDEVIPA